MTPPPSIRLAVAILSALVLLSVLATAGAAIFMAPQVSWALLGFECLTLLAALFGLAAAAGRFSDGPGLALACVAGTILAGSMFGYLGTTGQIGDWKMHYWLIGRVSVAGLLGVLAAWAVLRRTSGALALALRGAVYTGAAIGFVGILSLFGGEIRPEGGGGKFVGHAACAVAVLGAIPLCVLFALITVGTKSKPDDTIPKWMRLFGQLSYPVVAGALLFVTAGHMTTTLNGPHEVARLSLLTALAMVLTGLLCAGIHTIVQAFASCSLPDPDAPVLTPTQGATSS